MKRKTTVLALGVLILTGICYADGFFNRISLRGYGGYAKVGFDDYNTIIAGQEQYMDDWLLPLGLNRWGNLEKIESGFTFGGDLLVGLTKNFYLTLGVGSRSYGKKTDAAWAQAVAGRLTITVEPSFCITSLTLGVSAFFPLSSKVDFYARAAPGMYWADGEFDFRQDLEFITFEGWALSQNTAKGHGIGFEGGVGLEFMFSRKVGFFVEGGGYLVRIGELRGDWMYEDSDGISESVTDAKIWFFEVTDDGVEYYPTFGYADSQPAGAEIRNVRPFRLNVSGLAAKVGIVVRFR